MTKHFFFRKFLIPDAFKYVRLQNTFNRCNVHQILPQLCLPFGEVHKLSERNVYIDDLFFARSCKIHVIEHKFLKESCKIFLLVIEHSFLQESCKNLARILQEFCNNAIASKNLARIKFSVN